MIGFNMVKEIKVKITARRLKIIFQIACPL
jgi:hypothetical protein